MSDMIKIAVDAMGGDGSPKKIIDGIILNHSKNKNNFFKIFGDKNKIDPLIQGKIPTRFFELIHTESQKQYEVWKSLTQLMFVHCMNQTIKGFDMHYMNDAVDHSQT